MAAKDVSPRAFQRMLSGRRLDLLDPSPLDIEIEDIAHGLARVARWNGQTQGPHIFSVAQHSVLVEHIAGLIDPGIPARWRMMVLLHDAPEYVIGDMISPFKAVIGDSYKAVEDRLLGAIHLRFSLPATQPVALKKLCKDADKASAFIEATSIAGFTVSESEQFFGRPKIAQPGAPRGNDWRKLQSFMQPMESGHAETLFLQRFGEIESAMQEGSK